MKTKEQLSDEKLFADFIKLYIEFGHYEDDDYWYYKSEFSKNGWREFNPQDDWNLLHKAYNKTRIITIDNNQEDVVFKYSLKTMEVGLILNDSISVYDSILIFIKCYNRINTNTNNNQS